MDKHNKHSKNKNKGVNKPSVPVSGGSVPEATGAVSTGVPAAKPQSKPVADKRK